MTNALLYTLPQWFIFAALFCVVYGWIENKKVFRASGMGIFILLGCFSIYAISSGCLAPGAISQPESPNNMQNTPIEVRLFPAYLSFIIASFFAIVGIFFDLKDKKYARLIIVITGIIAIVGFFIVVGTIRPN
jgi:hypothetical protein